MSADLTGGHIITHNNNNVIKILYNNIAVSIIYMRTYYKYRAYYLTFADRLRYSGVVGANGIKRYNRIY